jgi:hypothetical protein
MKGERCCSEVGKEFIDVVNVGNVAVLPEGLAF